MKLNIQSLLSLLFKITPSLTIFNQNCGSLCSNQNRIFTCCKIEARLLHKLPQFWLKIVNLGVFLIRSVRRLWIFNFNWFDQLCNFEFIKLIAKFSFASWGLDFDVIEKLISQAYFSYTKAYLTNSAAVWLNFLKKGSSLMPMDQQTSHKKFQPDQFTNLVSWPFWNFRKSLRTAKNQRA